MRVATLNTWGMRGDWAARLPVFRQGFRELDADIVRRIFDHGLASASDHYGLAAEFGPPPEPGR